ncbi:MAG: response regulator [Chitinispirillaceae bacterium]|nr:response regulator [Chitinispirillaceae bacterium]
MKVLLLDDARARRNHIKDAVSRLYHEVTDCYSSNDFISVIQESNYDIILLDMDTWRKGRSIYNYFRIGKKLENLPILLYNADEDTYFIQDRARHEKDRVLSKPSEVDAIIEALQQNY